MGEETKIRKGFEAMPSSRSGEQEVIGPSLQLSHLSYCACLPSPWTDDFRRKWQFNGRTWLFELCIG